MGLLDDFNTSTPNTIDPANYGLLSAGLGILAASPGKPGMAAIGQGAAQGLQAYQNVNLQNYALKKDAIQNKIMQLQLAQSLRQQQLLDPVYQRLGGLFGNGTQPAPTAAPSGPTMDPSQVPGSTAPTNSGTGQAPGSSFDTIGGLSPDTAALTLALGGPSELGKAIAGANSPTDFVKTLRAAGIDPSSALGKQMIQGQIAKLNNIPPLAVRQGGGAIDPQGNIIMTMPKMPENALPTIENGRVVGVSPLPGGAPIEQMNSAAIQAGKNQMEPMTAYSGNQPVFTDKLTAAQGGVQPQPNNNPGNMRPPGASTGFQQFSTPEAGLAAMDQNLQAYAGKGINTLSGIITRWAPPGENNTAAYISDVSKRLGVPPDQPLDMSNPAVRQAISTGIMIHEQGSSRLFGQPSQAQQGRVAPALAPGVAESQKALATAGAKRYNDIIQQAAESPMRVNVLDNILNLSRSGTLSGPGQEWKNAVKGYAANTPFLSSVMSGSRDDVSNFQELNKFMYQNAQRNWQAAGGTGTDTQMEAFSRSNPNSKMFPQALQMMAQWGKGGELALQGKANAMQNWKDANGGNVANQDQFERTWRNNFDPQIYILKAMQPADAQAFTANLQKTNPTGYASLLMKMQTLQKMGGL